MNTERKRVMKSNDKPVKADYGEKMIEMRVRLFTSDLAGGTDRIRPRHAWACGTVRMHGNKAHGITTERKKGDPAIFNSLMDVGLAIEKVLIANGITLHPARQMKRYIWPSEVIP